MIYVDALKEWQTLVSGFIAIAAALIGGRYINRQMRQTQDLEVRRWDRRLLAARAVMPLTLSSLSAWTRDAASALRIALSHCQNGHLPAAAELTPVPLPPTDAIAALERIIEAAGSERVAEAIALLLSKIQVFAARSSEVAQRRAHHLLGRRDLEGYVLDLAEIHARVAAMFDYARDETDEIPRHLAPDAFVSGVRMIDFLGDDRLEAEARVRWDRDACLTLLSGRGDDLMLRTVVNRNAELAMRRFGITAEGEGFRRDGHFYDRMEDAAAYAVIQARRSAGA